MLSVRASKLARWVAGILGPPALLLLLLASPLALSVIQGSTDQWELLSWIGQSYGGTSAALSGIAFLGVAASLLLQSREAKANREQGDRTLHQGLVRLAMEDPLYMAVWQPVESQRHYEWQRQQTYVSLVFSHWYSNWVTGAMTTSSIRVCVADLLRKPPAYTFWTEQRHSWLASGNREYERFGRIIDELYGETEKHTTAIRQLPSAPLAESPARGPSNDPRTPRIVEALVLGVSAGAAWAAIRRIQRRKS